MLFTRGARAAVLGSAGTRVGLGDAPEAALGAGLLGVPGASVGLSWEACPVHLLQSLRETEHS